MKKDWDVHPNSKADGTHQLLSTFLRDRPCQGSLAAFPPAYALVPSGSQWPEGMRLYVLCHILKNFYMFIQFRVSAISWELVITHQKPVFTASAKECTLHHWRVMWAKEWVRTGCSDSQAMVIVKCGWVSSPSLCVHTLQRAVLRVCGGEKQLWSALRNGGNWWAQEEWGSCAGVHSTAIASLVR